MWREQGEGTAAQPPSAHLSVSRSNMALMVCFSLGTMSTSALLSCMTLQQPSAVPQPSTAPSSLTPKAVKG